MLIDPRDCGPGNHVALQPRLASPDGRLLLYEIKEGGERTGRFALLDIESRKTLPDTLPRGYLRGFAFASDRGSFYYVHEPLDPRFRSAAVCSRRCGARIATCRSAAMSTRTASAANSAAAFRKRRAGQAAISSPPRSPIPPGARLPTAKSARSSTRSGSLSLRLSMGRQALLLGLHERRKAEIDALKVATNALEGCRCPESLKVSYHGP